MRWKSDDQVIWLKAYLPLNNNRLTSVSVNCSCWFHNVTTISVFWSCAHQHFFSLKAVKRHTFKLDNTHSHTHTHTTTCIAHVWNHISWHQGLHKIIYRFSVNFQEKSEKGFFVQWKEIFVGVRPKYVLSLCWTQQAVSTLCEQTYVIKGCACWQDWSMPLWLFLFLN